MSLLKKTPLYGNVETTRILDDNGSTRTDSVNYVDGAIKYPVRHTYTFQEKVYTQEQAKQKQEEFNKELEDNPVMLDPMFIPKKRSPQGDKNGFFYVVKIYTLLEY